MHPCIHLSKLAVLDSCRVCPSRAEQGGLEFSRPWRDQSRFVAVTQDYRPGLLSTVPSGLGAKF
jgi:hypothetical protein